MSVRKIRRAAQALSFNNLVKQAYQHAYEDRPFTCKYKLRYFQGVFKALRRNGVHEKAGVVG